MATNKQRRDAERLRLQRQLEQRRAREASRKRFTLIASIVATLVVIAAVVIGIVSFTGSDDKTAGKSGEAAASPSASPTGTSTSETADCTAAAKIKGAVSFEGVVVGNATNLKTEPKVCSTSASDPAKLEYKDLVVGKGATPALTSDVEVQYTGVLYKKGTQFDSSWASGKPVPFNLQGVVPGFTQGIGGNSAADVPPMKVGGRRIVILPYSLGYGEQGNPPTIPARTALVFVIDLVKVGK